MFKYYIYILLIMSTITLLIYIIDKIKAIYGMYRIRESILITFSLLGGSLGSLIGMYVIRHKNRKIKFVFFNWLFLIIHISLGVYLLTYAI